MRRASVAAALLSAALLSASRSGRAQERADGFYGRFEGDLELRAHAGAAFASGGPGFAAQITALYLSTAGVYVHYTDTFGSDGPRVPRSISTGVHLQPLFLARVAVNAERGPAWVDLVIDSLAFELGAVWSASRGAPLAGGSAGGPMAQAPPAAWDDHPGLEAALSLAFPFLPRATGPFLGLRGALRWRPGDFVAGAPGSAVDRGAVLSLTLGWHHVLRTHLVDGGDRVLP